MKKTGRGFIVYALAFSIAIMLIYTFVNPQTSITSEAVGYSELMERVEDGEIKQIYAQGNDILALKINSEIIPERFPEVYDISSTAPSQEVLDAKLSEISKNKGKPISEIVTVTYNPEPEPSLLARLLPSMLSIGLIVLIFFYFMKQSQNSNNKAMSFGKSQAKMHVDGKNEKTFDDVAGAVEEKRELEELVDFLKNPDRFTKMGARIPKGVLLVGPPGTGKTLLAKAVAGEADVPFFSISGSDFVEMFVGVGASRVRDMFKNAKRNSPCILFIDEIDAVGRHRGAGMGGGHDEREQTLNQLLTEMDGFESNEGIIVLAATNRRDILDPALLRPGRFDRQVVVSYPDVKGREEIFEVHAKNKPMDDDVDFKVFARSTIGTTGADIENILNEAAILAAREDKKYIGNVDIQNAIMKVMLGPEKKSRLVTKKDQQITAYHEVGHAIVANKLPNCDDVHEISIISRGMAAGYTMTLPNEDMIHTSKSKLLDEIAMMLGGRVAEEVMVGDISTGASSDLKNATELARKMVVNFGMSDNIGTLFLGEGGEIFLGKEYGHTKNYSEDLSSRIDEEIIRMLAEAKDRATVIIKKNKALVKRVTKALLEREKLNKEEFQKLLDGKTLPPFVKAPPKVEKPKKEKEQKVEEKADKKITTSPTPVTETNL